VLYGRINSSREGGREGEKKKRFEMAGEGVKWWRSKRKKKKER
jgi:hypothetical protein